MILHLKNESKESFYASSFAQQYINKCDPILIYIDNQISINWTQNELFPECTFYNQTLKQYDGKGCYIK